MMSDLTWNSDQYRILIEFVRKHEGLYNVKCSDYKNSELKRNLWRRIGSILNKTDVECSKKWSYVKEFYVRRRANLSKGAGYEIARKRAELLSFIDGAKSNIDSENSHNDASLMDEVSNDVLVEFKTGSMSDDEYEYENTQPEEEFKNTSGFDNFDETDHFFMSMSKIVKKLPRREQVELRMQISTLVGNAELRHISDV